MINGLGLGLGLWSGVRLRRMVNCLRFGLGARLIVWVTLRRVIIGLVLGLGLWSGLRLRVMVWA